MLLALLALAPFCVAHAIPRKSSPGCVNFELPLNFAAQSLEPSFPPFENHYQAVDFLVDVTSRDPRAQQALVQCFNPDAQVNVTIAAKYCSPKGPAKNLTQVLTHGLGYDQSQYNYIKAANEAGYATLSYDRIGNGRSTKSDPYTITQVPIEVEVLRLLTERFAQGDITALKHISPSKKIVHVGHSFGSIVANLLIAKYPTVSDGLVQTGFSKNASASLLVAANAHLARENIPGWSKLSSSAGYLTWGDELANQYAFFHYGAFDPEVLAESEKIKQPTGVGEILTIGSWEAKDFAKPVLVFDGEHDQDACGSYCTTELLGQTAPLFPAAKPFSIYIQPDTGHGMNLHYNATGAYKVIQDWIEKNI
ncbi:hypothetical protein AC579_3230 [Pseudocercospora musae]|uniref:AB hydrolase-1 domain-containing protein n=1 Tax=Pseudocercospora musae TaxID=113226 RepID=A0A139ISH2_9PEZI|nr:hypothetical protein AC579_3230 [Pseudocercospora musae]